MARTNQQWNRQWVNDQLDLYNLAVSIGDSAWQGGIMDNLKQKNDIFESDQASSSADEFNTLLMMIAEKITEALALVEQERSKENRLDPEKPEY